MVVSEKTIKARELFSRRLRELLEARDMNQNELAKVLHVSESTVGKWTLGKSRRLPLPEARSISHSAMKKSLSCGLTLTTLPPAMR